MRIIKYFTILILSTLFLNANSSCYDIYKSEAKPDTKIDKAIFYSFREINICFHDYID